MIKSITDLQTEIGVKPDGVWGPVSSQALSEALKSRIIKITENISLNELLASDTSTRKGIDNTPTGTVQLKNLIEASNELWQPVRDYLGYPMVISSGYRSPKLNKAIGGAKNSAHLHGLAIDFVVPGFGDTRKIIRALNQFFKEKNIAFDQLILEYPNSPGSWVHLGYKHSSGAQRKQYFQIGA